MTRMATPLALAGLMILTACGGGGSSGGAPSATAPTPRTTVTGPLDVLQQPLSSEVLGALADGFAGSPLEGVLICADRAVVGDTLDVVDAVLVGLQPAPGQNPQVALTDAIGQAQEALAQLTLDLQGLLAVIGGEARCGTATTRPALLVSNPLAGTALAPLGSALLPALGTAQAALSGGDRSAGELAALLGTLQAAFEQGLATLPPEAREAPVVGALLTTAARSLDDLAVLLAAVQAQNLDGTRAAAAATVEHLLAGLSTEVVPLRTIETAGGQPGLVSSALLAGAGSLATVIRDGAGTPEGLNPAVLGPVLQALLVPLTQEILPALLAPFSGLLDNLPGAEPGPTGTLLDPLLNPLADLLGADGSNPLVTLLGELLGGSGDSDCVFANTPLTSLCELLGL